MAAVVRYREFWGAEKRAELLQSLEEEGAAFDARYAVLTPEAVNKFVLKLGRIENDYAGWAEPQALTAVAPFSGLQEMRKGTLLATHRAALEERIARYCDPTASFDQLRGEGVGPVADAGRFDPAVARRRLLDAGASGFPTIRRYAMQPFDDQWSAWTDVRPIWNEPRPELAKHVDGRNFLFVTRMKAERPHEYAPTYGTRHLPDYHLLRPNVVAIPAELRTASGLDDLLSTADPNQSRPNLSPAALAWTTSLGLPPTAETSRLVWHHALAITYSPAYLAENAAGIRQGWPRIPLPGEAKALRASAALGQRLAALLDADAPVPGVTEGDLPPALAAIAIPSTRPGAAKDWRCTNWGNATKTGVMPGRGHVSPRPYGVGEEATAAEAALLGAATLDIGMNAASFWRNIPEKVWEVHIGGYQVLKKWLSYRDGSILQRALTAEEVAHIQATARRLAAILLMGPELDESFRACAAAHVPLPSA